MAVPMSGIFENVDVFEPNDVAQAISGLGFATENSYALSPYENKPAKLAKQQPAEITSIIAKLNNQERIALKNALVKSYDEQTVDKLISEIKQEEHHQEEESKSDAFITVPWFWFWEQKKSASDFIDDLALSDSQQRLHLKQIAKIKNIKYKLTKTQYDALIAELDKRKNLKHKDAIIQHVKESLLKQDRLPDNQIEIVWDDAWQARNSSKSPWKYGSAHYGKKELHEFAIYILNHVRIQNGQFVGITEAFKCIPEWSNLRKKEFALLRRSLVGKVKAEFLKRLGGTQFEIPDDLERAVNELGLATETACGKKVPDRKLEEVHTIKSTSPGNLVLYTEKVPFLWFFSRNKTVYANDFVTSLLSTKLTKRHSLSLSQRQQLQELADKSKEKTLEGKQAEINKFRPQLRQAIVKKIAGEFDDPEAIQEILTRLENDINTIFKINSPVVSSATASRSKGSRAVPSSTVRQQASLPLERKRDTSGLPDDHGNGIGGPGFARQPEEEKAETFEELQAQVEKMGAEVKAACVKQKKEKKARERDERLERDRQKAAALEKKKLDQERQQAEELEKQQAAKVEQERQQAAALRQAEADRLEQQRQQTEAKHKETVSSFEPKLKQLEIKLENLLQSDLIKFIRLVKLHEVGPVDSKESLLCLTTLERSPFKKGHPLFQTIHAHANKYISDKLSHTDGASPINFYKAANVLINVYEEQFRKMIEKNSEAASDDTFQQRINAIKEKFQNLKDKAKVTVITVVQDKKTDAVDTAGSTVKQPHSQQLPPAALKGGIDGNMLSFFPAPTADPAPLEMKTVRHRSASGASLRPSGMVQNVGAGAGATSTVPKLFSSPKRKSASTADLSGQESEAKLVIKKYEHRILIDMLIDPQNSNKLSYPTPEDQKDLKEFFGKLAHHLDACEGHADRAITAYTKVKAANDLMDSAHKNVVRFIPFFASTDNNTKDPSAIYLIVKARFHNLSYEDKVEALKILAIGIKKATHLGKEIAKLAAQFPILREEPASEAGVRKQHSQ